MRKAEDAVEYINKNTVFFFSYFLNASQIAFYTRSLVENYKLNREEITREGFLFLLSEIQFVGYTSLAYW